MGTVVITSVVIFTVVLLLLAVIIIIADAKLVPHGDVVINVNGERKIETGAGGKLLDALTSNGINLPSACGGKGSCGVCKCKVSSGGGELLPTETGFISRKQAKNNERLACQVPVKEDMQVEVPAEVFSIKKWECTVESNRNVSTFIKEFVVKLPEGENFDFQAGGYAQIEIPAYELDYKNFDIEEQYRGDWDKFNVWQFKATNTTPLVRAYSMASYPAEGNRIMLNVRIASPPPDRTSPTGWKDVPPGIASSYIFDRKPGDKVTMSGPYGDFFIRDTPNEKMYIGGGAGMAPLRAHIMHMFKTQKTTNKVSFWYGARTLREAFYLEDFAEIEKEFDNFKFNLALDNPLPEDNWEGYKGFIHNVVLENYLKDHPAPEDIEYYLCGPPMMMQAVNKMLYDLGVEKDMIIADDFGG